MIRFYSFAVLLRATIGPTDEDIQWMNTGVVKPQSHAPPKKRRKKHVYKMPSYIKKKLRGEAISEPSMGNATLRTRRVRRPKYLQNHVPIIYGAGILPTCVYRTRCAESCTIPTTSILKPTANNYKVIERRFRKRHAKKMRPSIPHVSADRCRAILPILIWASRYQPASALSTELLGNTESVGLVVGISLAILTTFAIRHALHTRWLQLILITMLMVAAEMCTSLLVGKVHLF